MMHIKQAQDFSRHFAAYNHPTRQFFTNSTSWIALQEKNPKLIQDTLQTVEMISDRKSTPVSL
jgi:hypothetical protein